MYGVEDSHIKKDCCFLGIVSFVFTAVLSGSCDKATSDPRLAESLATSLFRRRLFRSIQNTEITLSTRLTLHRLRFNADFKVVVTITDLVYENTRSKSIWNLLRIVPHDTVSVRRKSNDRIDVFSPYPSKYPNMETVSYSTQNYLQLTGKNKKTARSYQAHVEELKDEVNINEKGEDGYGFI